MINVFVIDDHPIMVEGLSEAFKDKKDGINIAGFAYSAKQALKKLRNTPADAIILDLAMPGVSGVELCTAIKSLFPEKKIVVLTGESDILMLKNVWINGADAILSKYCGKYEIKNTIEQVLENRRIIDKDIRHYFEEAMQNN